MLSMCSPTVVWQLEMTWRKWMHFYRQKKCRVSTWLQQSSLSEDWWNNWKVDKVCFKKKLW